MYIKKVKKNYENTGKSYFVFQLFEEVEEKGQLKQIMVLSLGPKLNIPESEHQALADCIESKVRKKTSNQEFSQEIETMAESFAAQLKKREKARKPFSSSAPLKKTSFRSKDSKPAKRPSLGFKKFSPRSESSSESELYSSERKPRFGNRTNGGFKKFSPRSESLSESEFDSSERKPRFGNRTNAGFKKFSPRSEGSSERDFDSSERKPRFGNRTNDGFKKFSPRSEGSSEREFDSSERKPRFGNRSEAGKSSNRFSKEGSFTKKKTSGGEKPAKPFSKFSKKPSKFADSKKGRSFGPSKKKRFD